MALSIIGKTSGNIVEVDSDLHLPVNVRPPAFGTLGSYRVSTVSGAIAATLGAASTLFSMRWTDATRLCLIQEVRASCIVSGLITAGVLFDLEAVVARSFSVSDSTGTAVSFTSPNQKLRASMGASLMGDMRIAGTAALTAGTRTPDALAIGRIQGFTGTSVGTQVFGSGLGTIPLYMRDTMDQHPIILVQNEGLLIRNPLAGPATGTINVAVTVDWIELAAY